jgi:hypothetical protein
VLVLPGCATSPTPPWDAGVDSTKIGNVERAAAQSGVKVYWINAPRKPVKKDG